ncbi:DNA damage-inducible protein DinB [Asticcacaulis sp. AC460]|uniref:DinB family protein n=1 Tax=Asticcacaulis sp. AC460 TaxID=1282360 RepID=UPI0003C3E82F|nr:DinB family protein [Asticcacaulis sp. AC460]ESQ90079.1 DNA damage-inducible protein DinB [Asticcacaulis sp. AC460]
MDSATLDALAGFPDQLEAHYRAIPDGFELWTPSSWTGCPSEPYSALEQLCHIRDIEIDGYHVRFVRTLKEDRPFLPGVDGDRLKVLRSYSESFAPDVLDDIRQAREETLVLLATVSAEQWRRTCDFEDYGVTTLRGLVHYLCSHDQQHLAGLQWLAGKIESSTVE